MKSLSKKQLIENVSKTSSISQVDVRVVIELAIEEITNTLVDGGKVELRDFMLLKTKMKKGRVARNPKTGEEVTIEERRVVSFKPGKKLKNLVSSNSI